MMLLAHGNNERFDVNLAKIKQTFSRMNPQMDDFEVELLARGVMAKGEKVQKFSASEQAALFFYISKVIDRLLFCRQFGYNFLPLAIEIIQEEIDRMAEPVKESMQDKEEQ